MLAPLIHTALAEPPCNTPHHPSASRILRTRARTMRRSSCWHSSLCCRVTLTARLLYFSTSSWLPACRYWAQEAQCSSSANASGRLSCGRAVQALHSPKGLGSEIPTRPPPSNCPAVHPPPLLPPAQWSPPPFWCCAWPARGASARAACPQIQTCTGGAGWRTKAGAGSPAAQQQSGC